MIDILIILTKAVIRRRTEVLCVCVGGGGALAIRFLTFYNISQWRASVWDIGPYRVSSSSLL